jgi:hypothetical protein
MTINEDNVKLAPARECCDACGHEMTPADYDAIHGTVLVSVTGKLGEVVIHGDTWTLMCPECYHAFQSVFADFKRERANS